MRMIRSGIRRYPGSMAGITLIELLTVMVVIAVLSSLAISSYRRYLLRVNRTDATATLLRIQVAQEKYFLQNNAYVQSLTNISTAPPTGLGVSLGDGGTTPRGYYTMAITATDTTYTITATATGNQVNDTAACLTFTIDQTGARTPADSTGCWR
ncbi:MAG: type IV pilin protein [Steroidobacteraceae bacterium]